MSEPVSQPAPVLFIPHGGGPLPLLGDNGHQQLIAFLKQIPNSFKRPAAIVVISAHWEEQRATITSGESPTLIYDYSGFPEESYAIEYPVPGNPKLARQIIDLLQKSGIDAQLDEQRGFDHGLFVPLKIMYPDATIPCVQMSLVSSLDPKTHIKLGNALADLRKEDVLIIGSGFSFHNLRAFFSPSVEEIDTKNEAFERWLIDTCTDKAITTEEREARLINWDNAPHAAYCHPRADHLLPLHICFGVANSTAELVFDDKILGKKSCAFLW